MRIEARIIPRSVTGGLMRQTKGVVMNITQLAEQIEQFKSGRLGFRSGFAATDGVNVTLSEEKGEGWAVPVTVIIEESAEYQAEVILRRVAAKLETSRGIPGRNPGFF